MNRKHQKQQATRITPPNSTGIVVHALHKSGSMFVYQLLFRLCRARGIRFYSANHPQPDLNQVTPKIAHDFCMGPIREFSLPFPFEATSRLQRIFHVRDPRDLLVSQYFSYGWRHADQQFDTDQLKQRQRIQSMSLDDYVLCNELSVRAMKRRLAPLVDQLNDHRQTKDARQDIKQCQDIILVKYEQMVCNFSGWLDQILPVFGFRFPSLAKARFAFRYRNEFLPDEHCCGHKRSVTPGDHRRQLKPATIERLNETFSAELELLGYESRQWGHADQSVA